MSASFGNSNQNSGDFELNLASMIDCFTVLIAFLLASSSFLSIGALDVATLAASQSDPTASVSKEWTPVFEWKSNQLIEIRNLDSREVIHRLAVPPSLREMKSEEWKTSFEHLNGAGKWAILTPPADLPADELVALISALKKRFPSISLAPPTQR